MGNEMRWLNGKMAGWIGFNLVLCSGYAAPTGAQTPAFVAQYTIYKGELRLGEAHLALAYPQPTHAVYTTKIKPVGFLSWLVKPVTEQAAWQIQNQTLQPLHYQFDSGKTTTREQVHFDWQQREVWDSGAKPWKLPLPDHTLDFASVRFALLQDISAGKTELSYTIADGGKLKPYHFTLLGTESIASPLGPVDTLKVERQHKTRTTTLWLAQSLHFLPVQLQQSKKGELLFQLRLQHIEFDPAPSPPQPQQTQ